VEVIMMSEEEYYDDVFDELAFTKEDNYLLLDKERIECLCNGLVVLFKKGDDNILIELRAAYKSLEDYINILQYSEDNQFILSMVEGCLIKNTGLNPELTTKSGIYKNTIMAYSYYGLYIVSVIKGSYFTAKRYIARMFESNPRVARELLAPEIYKKYFKSKVDEYCKLQLSILPIDPRVNKKSVSIPDLEFYESQVLVHKEVLECKIDELCISIARKMLKNYS
jgi:hypothetical protein